MAADDINPILCYDTQASFNTVSRYPPFKNIISYLGVEEKKNLRICSSSMYYRVKEVENRTFKDWKFNGLNLTQLQNFVEDADTIKGLEVNLVGGERVAPGDRLPRWYSMLPPYVPSSFNPFRGSVGTPLFDITDKTGSNVELVGGEPEACKESLPRMPVPATNASSGPILCDSTVEKLVEKFPGIESINLKFVKETGKPDADIKDAGFRALLSLDRLKKLQLYSCSVTGAGLTTDMVKSVNIQKLELVNTQISNTGLAAVLNACGGSLKILTLDKVEDDGLTGFSGMFSHLVEFRLYSDKFTDKGFLHVLSKCGPNLKTLILNAGITGDNLDPNVLPALAIEYFEIKNEGFSSKGLAAVLAMWRGTLRHVEMYSRHIGDEAFGAVTTGMLENIERLIILGSVVLSDQGLLQLINMCGPNLVELHLAESIRIKGEIIDKVDASFPRLTTLNLCLCESLTYLGVSNFIIKLGSNLTSLNLAGVEFTGPEIYPKEGELSKLKFLSLETPYLYLDQILYWILRKCGDPLVELLIPSRSRLSSRCKSWIKKRFKKILITDSM